MPRSSTKFLSCRSTVNILKVLPHSTIKKPVGHLFVIVVSAHSYPLECGHARVKVRNSPFLVECMLFSNSGSVLLYMYKFNVSWRIKTYCLII